MFDVEFEAQKKRSQQVQEYIFGLRMKQDTNLSYPILPYSEQYIRQLKSGYSAIVEELDIKNNDLKADKEQLIHEMKLQADHIVELKNFGENL